jgi:hypothetical protein
MEATHEELWGTAKILLTDYTPYGKVARDDGADYWGADCSCGCTWFHPLDGERGMDWGVCFNPESPRCGLLTFEHQGCKYCCVGIEEDEDYDIQEP